MTSELLVPKAAWHSYPMLDKDIQTHERDTGQGGARFLLDAPAYWLEKNSRRQVQQQWPTLSSRSQSVNLVTVQTLQRQSVTGHLERKAVINSQRTDAQKTSHQQNTSIVATALERPETRAPS